MYKEILVELVRNNMKIEQNRGRMSSLYLLLTIQDLKEMKSPGIEHIKSKIAEVMGINEYNSETKKVEFVSPNQTLVDLFQKLEAKTTVRDLNKSWNKKYYYRTTFPILDYRSSKPANHIDKVIDALEKGDGTLDGFNQIHSDIIESGKKRFMANFKRYFTEKEVFEQFGVSYERYYSDERVHLLSELDQFYFDETFLKHMKELLLYIKETYNKPDVVIYIDFNHPVWSNEEIYSYEHSLFVMMYGFLKNDILSVKEENGKKTIYGFLPLMSFDNDNKKTYKNYGRGRRPNTLITAEEMLAYYETGIFDCNELDIEIPIKIAPGLEVTKRIAFVNSKKKETVLAESIIRNNLSARLPTPQLPFEHTRGRKFQDKNDLFKEVRDILFNHPIGFYQDFYKQLLDGERIQNLNVEARKFTSELKDLVIRTHPQFKEFFDGNVSALKPLFPRVISQILEERIVHTNFDAEDGVKTSAKPKKNGKSQSKEQPIQKSKRKDVQDLINLCSYLRQVTFQNEEVITLNEAREKLASIANGDEAPLSKNEFFYAVGQLSYYYASKSKSKKKMWDMFEKLLVAKTVSKMMEEQRRLKMQYLHEIHINDMRHSNIDSAVLSSSVLFIDSKIGLKEQIYFESGLVDKNAIYQKKEQPETEDSTNEEE